MQGLNLITSDNRIQQKFVFIYFSRFSTESTHNGRSAKPEGN